MILPCFRFELFTVYIPDGFHLPVIPRDAGLTCLGQTGKMRSLVLPAKASSLLSVPLASGPPASIPQLHHTRGPICLQLPVPHPPCMMRRGVRLACLSN
ncbi:hypothetical protein RRG08_050131 [Elysia crispata]|uniref:Uncharacterized protein n=1 Tax=Elysia crispata TaxID=231223 RepID=A0AAE1DAI4_9GAST|nr:hypothetical protein RRG08_050131 [Elysia crispata]